LSNPGAHEADAERLEIDVQKPENYLLLPTFHRLTRAIQQWPRTRAPRRTNAYFDERGDTHLARMRISRESLVAAAAMEVARASPEIFGQQPEAGAYEAKIAKLVAERQGLFDQIQVGWQRSDVTEQHVEDGARASGLCKLTVNITGGQVPIGPDLGQRAVHWWLEHHPARPVAPRRLKAA
jgi:hypothetical protein